MNTYQDLRQSDAYMPIKFQASAQMKDGFHSGFVWADSSEKAKKLIEDLGGTQVQVMFWKE